MFNTGSTGSVGGATDLAAILNALAGITGNNLQADAPGYYAQLVHGTQNALRPSLPTYPGTTGATGSKKKSGGSSTFTQTQRSFTQYSAQQLQSAATDAAQQAIGRALTAKELARLTKHINALEQKNPTITTQTTTSGGHTSSTSSKTKGGINEAQAMKSWAEQNPEYASYQQATTYFDSMLSALRGPAGGSV